MYRFLCRFFRSKTQYCVEMKAATRPGKDSRVSVVAIYRAGVWHLGTGVCHLGTGVWHLGTYVAPGNRCVAPGNRCVASGNLYMELTWAVVDLLNLLLRMSGCLLK